MTEEVRQLLRTCKKPKGLLQGDFLPELIPDLIDDTAPPLTKIPDEGRWQDVWKKEIVSIIPKCDNPETLGQTRNISCTPIFSKVLEYLLLTRLKTEIMPRLNQFGGIKRSGTNHYLAEAWTNVLEALDQEGSVASMVSVDFSKAFNTMSHQACISFLERKEVSPNLIQAIRSFLTERTMCFKVGNSLSSSRKLRGGSPQGTILGNFLFILTTDELELAERR